MQYGHTLINIGINTNNTKIKAFPLKIPVDSHALWNSRNTHNSSNWNVYCLFLAVILELDLMYKEMFYNPLHIVTVLPAVPGPAFTTWLVRPC